MKALHELATKYRSGFFSSFFFFPKTPETRTCYRSFHLITFVTLLLLIPLRKRKSACNRLIPQKEYKHCSRISYLAQHPWDIYTNMSREHIQNKWKLDTLAQMWRINLSCGRGKKKGGTLVGCSHKFSTQPNTQADKPGVFCSLKAWYSHKSNSSLNWRF